MNKKILILPLFFLFNFIFAQSPIWKVIAPQRDSIVSNESLFISFSVTNYPVDNGVIVLLDNKPVVGNLKTQGNIVNLLSFSTLPDGLHQVYIKAFIKALNRNEEYHWNFYIKAKKGSSIQNNTPPTDKSKEWAIEGNFSADNRNEFLNGQFVDSFRQEPVFTRSVSLDMDVRHNKLEIPIKFYATSDNISSGYLPRNFFQIGLHYKKVAVDFGDLNPSLDQLIVSGIRVNGLHLKLSLGKSSFQVYGGYIVKNAIEGSVNAYTPGSGYIPPTLFFDANDSSFKYITPGVYKRWMYAGRFEFKQNKKNTFGFGITGSKVTDVVKSIKYGLQPKDNLVAGVDMYLKLFRKTVQISGEIACSALTNDISYGILNTAKLNSVFNIGIAFNPASFYPYITINSSTVPGNLHNVTEALAYTTRLTHTKRSHSFTFEYRKYGGAFYSLGNPYLRNNYKGLSVNERFGLLKRKIIISLSYQSFTNNLNSTLPMLVNTNTFNGNFTLNINPKLPTIYFSYMQQQRNGESNLKSAIPSVNDFIYYYNTSINYKFHFLNHDHNIRTNFSINERKDQLNPQTRNIMSNYLLGYNADFKRFAINTDGGQTVIKDFEDNKIANIFTYSGNFEYKIIPKTLTTSFGVSNNRNLRTYLSTSSSRMAYIYRIIYRCANGMEFNLEGGYTPYKDYNESVNNYDEKYVYLRYTYNFDFHLH